MALSATALTSIASAESFVGLTAGAQNAQLEILINGVSKRIEDYLLRNILSQSYSEIYDTPSGELVLKQPDVTAVGFLANSYESAMTITYTGADTNARAEVTETGVTLVSRAGATSTSNTLTFATNVTTTALAAAANLISGWTATVVTITPSAYLVRAGSQVTKSRVLTLEAWEEYDGEYQTDYLAGIIRFGSSWGGWSDSYGYGGGVAVRSQLRIDYTAGLSAIPAGVELTALEMVRDAWFARTRDGAMQSESLGDYSYSIGGDASVESNPEWCTRLTPFVRRLP